MRSGGRYITVFVTTFLYFYIYAVNYVRAVPAPEVCSIAGETNVMLSSIYIIRRTQMRRGLRT